MNNDVLDIIMPWCFGIAAICATVVLIALVVALFIALFTGGVCEVVT